MISLVIFILASSLQRKAYKEVEGECAASSERLGASGEEHRLTVVEVGGVCCTSSLLVLEN